MRDEFTEATKEMQEKSPFVCTSCGHPHDIVKLRKKLYRKPAEVHDEFSEAVREEGEKSAFVCESCGSRQTLSSKELH